MRAKWIGIGVLVTLVLVLVITAVSWMFWQRSTWGYGMPGSMMGNQWNAASCPADNQPRNTGRMGWGMGNINPAYGCYAQSNGGDIYATAPDLDLGTAEEKFQDYIGRYYDEDLEIAELMEFERNFYAIIIEKDTGIGAMELLIDKATGAVGPEMGPNMMWNSEYGMHGRGMMGAYAGDPVHDEQDMLTIAQSWLNERKPGVTTEENGDMFYGYMTAHTMKDGEMDGMLSVNAATGDVWYHTWHGDFIAMQSYEDNGE